MPGQPTEQMGCQALLLANIKNFGTRLLGHIWYRRDVQENITYATARAGGI